MICKQNQKYRLIVTFGLILACSLALWAGTSYVQKFPRAEVSGQGPLPYNYRIIDKNIHAGGHPLNPANAFVNKDKQVLATLHHLRSKGVRTVIDLENTPSIQERYSRLLKQAGMVRIHIPLHASKLPTAKEWEKIRQAMKGPVYIHCKWGADRTGAVIARYLVEEKGYAPEAAWKAVITGGTHAGPLGGLKKGRSYAKLVLFFWPDAEKSPDFKANYR